MKIILVIIGVLCIITKFMDCYTTLKVIKNSKDIENETNVIGRVLFRSLGIKGGMLLAFMFATYIIVKSIYKYWNEDRTNQIYLCIVLLLFAISHIFIAIANHSGKGNFVTKSIVFLIPIYWDWRKILSRFKKP